MSDTDPAEPQPTPPSPPEPADDPAGAPLPAPNQDASAVVPAGSDPRPVGERIRELADAEAARVEAEEAAHPLAKLGASPITAADLDGTDYAPCPFCEGWGATEPDALLAALPEVVERLAPFPQSSTFQRCGECDGWGRVLTGGRMQENGIQPCPTCDGHGYQDRRAMAETAGNGTGGGSPPPAPPFSGPDLMRLSPGQGGSAPAAGMVWFDDRGVWGYPVAAP